MPSVEVLGRDVRNRAAKRQATWIAVLRVEPAALRHLLHAHTRLRACILFARSSTGLKRAKASTPSSNLNRASSVQDHHGDQCRMPTADDMNEC